MRPISDHDVNANFCFSTALSNWKAEFFWCQIYLEKQGEVYTQNSQFMRQTAKESKIEAEFNQYEGWRQLSSLTKIHHAGVYWIEVPGSYEWATYKYEIHPFYKYCIKLILMVIIVKSDQETLLKFID